MSSNIFSGVVGETDEVAWILTRPRLSIREFCELKMPILMFDKDGNYCVLRLEDVGP